MKKLSRTTILFHWVIALGFLATMSIPFLPEDLSSVPTHKSMGVIILVLAVFRIIWRIKEGFPPPTSDQAKIIQGLAKLAHVALLLATVAMPGSGIAMSIGAGKGVAVFGWVLVEKSATEIEWLKELGSGVHFSALYVLLVLIGLHIAAAIVHEHVYKDKTLSRMLGKGEDE